MKKTIITAIAISTLLGALLLSIPKKDLPTDEQWNSYINYLDERFGESHTVPCDCLQEDCIICADYLEYEEQLYKDIDAGLYD